MQSYFFLLIKHFTLTITNIHWYHLIGLYFWLTWIWLLDKYFDSFHCKNKTKLEFDTLINIWLLYAKTNTEHRPRNNSIHDIPVLPRTDSTSEFMPVDDKEVEYFFASDASAVIEHTNRVIYLEVWITLFILSAFFHHCSQKSNIWNNQLTIFEINLSTFSGWWCSCC